MMGAVRLLPLLAPLELLESSGTRGQQRKIEAAADRMVDLGLSVEETEDFRDLAQP